MKTETVLPIIMAGGMGSRLSPLTKTVPKPLLPIDGKPAICRILDFLRENGFRRAVITVRYRAEDIYTALGESYRGIHIMYADENGIPTPPGTAGGVRLAWESYAHASDTDAFVLSGDAVFCADLDAFFRVHRQGKDTKEKADATILCVRVPDPGAFGVVLSQNGFGITGFCEKPSAREAVSDTVNTGIYLLSASLIKDIPLNRSSDFGQNIFPAALRAGRDLRMYLSPRYWCDIGSFDAYLDASLAIAKGAIEGIPPAKKPHFGSACRASVGEDCIIPDSATVWDSVLLDGVILGEDAAVFGSIVARGVRVGRGAVIGEGCVIGEGAVIGDNVTLPSKTRLLPGAHVTNSQGQGCTGDIAAPSHRSRFSNEGCIAPYLCDAGYLLSEQGAYTPSVMLCASVIGAVATLCLENGMLLLIARDRETPALTSAQTLLKEALFCLNLCEPNAFFVDEAICPSVIRMPHLSSVLPTGQDKKGVFRVLLTTFEGRVCAAFFDDLGLYIDRKTERKLDTYFAMALIGALRPEKGQSPSPHLPHTLSAKHLYETYIKRYHSPISQSITFRCGTSPDERFLAQFLSRCGARESIYAPILLRLVKEDGGMSSLSLYDLSAKLSSSHLSHNDCLLLLSDTAPAYENVPFPTPRTQTVTHPYISLPVTVPSPTVACLHYSHCPSVSDDASDEASVARMHAAMESEDGVLLAQRLLALLSHVSPIPADLGTLRKKCAPHTEFRKTERIAARNATRILRHLTQSGCGNNMTFRPATEGVVFWGEDGASVRVVSSRDGNFRIIADAYTTEAAEALCHLAKERILRQSAEES